MLSCRAPSCRTMLYGGLAFLLTACSDSPPTQPPPGEPGIRAVLGAGATDTIDAPRMETLVVEVRKPDGHVAKGAVVRFEAQLSSDPARRAEAGVSVCGLTVRECGPSIPSRFAVDTTDAAGRASALILWGRVAGRAVVQVSAPELGLLDSATFTVMPGAAVRVRALVADTTLDIGATAVLQGRALDRHDNTRAEAPTPVAGAGTAFTLDPATGTVTARELGVQSVILRYGVLVDSTRVRVLTSGRLVVWSFSESAVRLVNVNGSNTRTLVSGVTSDLGVFPRFDATRQRVTMQAGSATGFGTDGGPPNTLVVVDTTGGSRRELGPVEGFIAIIALRQLADGTVLVVGQRPLTSANALWRVAPDGAISLVAPIPALSQNYAGADISHDGARVAYLVNNQLRVLDVGSGAVTVLEASARAPRWSPQDDRVAYLVPVTSGGPFTLDGSVVIINVDGTGRRAVSTDVFSPGLAWSPDGAYIVGRVSAVPPALRLLRVSTGGSVLLYFRTPAGDPADYFQPDWR